MIKLKRILYPTDFSDSSRNALQYAVSFARDSGAKLVLAHVVNEQIFSEGLSLPRVTPPEALEEELSREAERQLKAILPAGERAGLDWEIAVLRGIPFLEIVRYAKDSAVDLIVIGTHGRTGLEHVIFGSTAERVVRKAPCPVLTVRPA